MSVSAAHAATAEIEPIIAPVNGDRINAVEMSTQDLLRIAREIGASEEADTAACLAVARGILAAHSAEVAPEILQEATLGINNRYQTTETFPKAPNQATHPAMPAEDRAAFQHRRMAAINQSRNDLITKVTDSAPVDRVSGWSLIKEGTLTGSLEELKEDLREQAKERRDKFAELNPSLSQHGRVKRFASAAVGRFGIKDPQTDIQVEGGSEENLRQVLIDLIETLAVLRDPEQLGELVAGKHLADIPEEIRKRITHQYKPWEKTAIELLHEDLAELLDEANAQSHPGRKLSKANLRRIKRGVEHKSAGESAAVEKAIDPVAKEHRPALRSGISSIRVIHALGRLGFEVVHGEGKGSHTKMRNETGETIIISKDMSPELLGSILTQAGVSRRDFVDNLH